MNRLLKGIVYFVIGISIIALGYVGAYTISTIYDGFVTIREHEEKITDLISQDNIFIQDLQVNDKILYTLMGETTVLRNNQYFLLEQLQNKLDIGNKEFLELQKNYPLYKDLKDMTVYMVNAVSNESVGVGTGVVVKKTNTYSYILTNKHVCNKEDIGNCYIDIYKYNDFIRVPLKFVQEDSKYDLALWKTSSFLPNKKAIKGIKEALPQDKVYSVGNYLAIRDIYTEGTFAGYEEEYFLMNMPCSYGCSGSGVFDKNSNLISLIFAVNQISPFQVDSTKVLSIPTEAIKNFLKDIL